VLGEDQPLFQGQTKTSTIFTSLSPGHRAEVSKSAELSSSEEVLTKKKEQLNFKVLGTMGKYDKVPFCVVLTIQFTNLTFIMAPTSSNKNALVKKTKTRSHTRRNNKNREIIETQKLHTKMEKKICFTKTKGMLVLFKYILTYILNYFLHRYEYSEPSGTTYRQRTQVVRDKDLIVNMLTTAMYCPCKYVFYLLSHNLLIIFVDVVVRTRLGGN